MPLIECPDCGKQISDAPPTCPNCGRSFRETLDLEDDLRAEEPPQTGPSVEHGAGAQYEVGHVIGFIGAGVGVIIGFAAGSFVLGVVLVAAALALGIFIQYGR